VRHFSPLVGIHSANSIRRCGTIFFTSLGRNPRSNHRSGGFHAAPALATPPTLVDKALLSGQQPDPSDPLQAQNARLPDIRHLCTMQIASRAVAAM
jgi:hypothetical protein